MLVFVWFPPPRGIGARPFGLRHHVALSIKALSAAGEGRLTLSQRAEVTELLQSSALRKVHFLNFKPIKGFSSPKVYIFPLVCLDTSF